MTESTHAADSEVGSALPSHSGFFSAGWLKQFWATRLARVDTDELIIGVSLVALCVLVRSLWLTPVEIWGDAAQKWHFARQLAYENDFGKAYDWSHHMARFGVNIPVYLLQRVLGTAPGVYYVVPVASYALQVAFTYLVALKLSGRAAGIFCALFLIFYTGMIRSSSQLLPDGIAGTVFVVLTFLWLHFNEAQGRRRLGWLLAIALAFIWTYAIKESNVFFFPAVLACVWLSRRSVKEALIFVAIVALYGALETAGFAFFTKFHSRLSIVNAGHPGYDPITFWQLFERYTKLEPRWQMLIWLWVPSALWLATKRQKIFWPVLLIPAAFLFLLTFMVRRLDPLEPWIGNKSRYLSVIAPFLVLGISLFVVEQSRSIWVTYAPRALDRAAASVRRDLSMWTLVLCCMLGMVTYLREGRRFSALRELRQQASVLNDAYRRNLPIVEFASFPRGLNTAYSVHLREKYLAQARHAPPGTLLDINDAVRQSRLLREKAAYLVVNADVYGPNDMPAFVANGCAIVIETVGDSIHLRPNKKLPASCQAPGGAAPLPK